jgi:hypothetical protein
VQLQAILLAAEQRRSGNGLHGDVQEQQQQQQQQPGCISYNLFSGFPRFFLLLRVLAAIATLPGSRLFYYFIHRHHIYQHCHRHHHRHRRRHHHHHHHHHYPNLDYHNLDLCTQNLPKWVCVDPIQRDENNRNGDDEQNPDYSDLQQQQKQQQQRSDAAFESLIMYPPFWIPDPSRSGKPAADADQDLGICNNRH